jgi:hypothetical protein
MNFSRIIIIISFQIKNALSGGSGYTYLFIDNRQLNNASKLIIPTAVVNKAGVFYPRKEGTGGGDPFKEKKPT